MVSKKTLEDLVLSLYKSGFTREEIKEILKEVHSKNKLSEFSEFLEVLEQASKNVVQRKLEGETT